MNKRIEALAGQLALSDLDWMALNPGPSLRYLTGLNFHLMERPVVVLVSNSGQVKVILPELERAKVANLPFDSEIIPFGDDPATWQGVYEQALSDISGNPLRVGVEPTRLRFWSWNCCVKRCLKPNLWTEAPLWLSCACARELKS